MARSAAGSTIQQLAPVMTAVVPAAQAITRAPNSVVDSVNHLGSAAGPLAPQSIVQSVASPIAPPTDAGRSAAQSTSATASHGDSPTGTSSTSAAPRVGLPATAPLAPAVQNLNVLPLQIVADTQRSAPSTGSTLLPGGSHESSGSGSSLVEAPRQVLGPITNIVNAPLAGAGQAVGTQPAGGSIANAALQTVGGVTNLPANGTRPVTSAVQTVGAATGDVARQTLGTAVAPLPETARLAPAAPALTQSTVDSLTKSTVNSLAQSTADATRQAIEQVVAAPETTRVIAPTVQQVTGVAEATARQTLATAPSDATHQLLPIVQPIVAPVLNAAAATSTDVSRQLAPVVNQTINTVAGAAEGVSRQVAPIVDQTATAIVTTSDSVSAPAAPIVQPILGSVVGSAGQAVASVAQPPTQIAHQVAPIVQPITAPVVNQLNQLVARLPGRDAISTVVDQVQTQLPPISGIIPAPGDSEPTPALPIIPNIPNIPNIPDLPAIDELPLPSLLPSVEPERPALPLPQLPATDNVLSLGVPPNTSLDQGSAAPSWDESGATRRPVQPLSGRGGMAPVASGAQSIGTQPILEDGMVQGGPVGPARFPIQPVAPVRAHSRQPASTAPDRSGSEPAHGEPEALDPASPFGFASVGPEAPQRFLPGTMLSLLPVAPTMAKQAQVDDASLAARMQAPGSMERGVRVFAPVPRASAVISANPPADLASNPNDHSASRPWSSSLQRILFGLEEAASGLPAGGQLFSSSAHSSSAAVLPFLLALLLLTWRMARAYGRETLPAGPSHRLPVPPG
jgi:hypothetical protein